MKSGKFLSFILASFTLRRISFFWRVQSYSTMIENSW